MKFRPLLSFDVGALFGAKRDLLGLDIGSSAIKLVQMKQARGNYLLQKFGIQPLEPEVIVDGTVMDSGRVVSAIKELVGEHNVKLKNVAMSISGHSVIVKKINLPPMPDEELEGQVRLAAEQYIPFDINEVNIDFHILNPNEQSDDGQSQMSLLLVAAKKDKVTELSELVKAAGLNPVILDVDAFAIENMYGINYPPSPEDIVALVNIGASVMNVNIVRGETSLLTRDISIGGNRYTEAIQREMGVPYEEAEAAKKGERREGIDAEAVASVVDGGHAEISSEIAGSVTDDPDQPSPRTSSQGHQTTDGRPCRAGRRSRAGCADDCGVHVLLGGDGSRDRVHATRQAGEGKTAGCPAGTGQTGRGLREEEKTPRGEKPYHRTTRKITSRPGPCAGSREPKPGPSQAVVGALEREGE